MIKVLLFLTVLSLKCPSSAGLSTTPAVSVPSGSSGTATIPSSKELSSSSSSSSSTSIEQIANKGGSNKVRAASLNQQELDSKKFPRTWVPIASTFELDPDRPSPLEFLGQKYVTYKDKITNNWVVLDDICPHRLAPLSEGRIDKEKNVLQCSYHGWEFNASGACTHVPQVDGKVLETTLSSTRSCVASYPVHVEKNIMFVWPWKEDVLSVVVANDDPLSASPEGILDGVSDNPTSYTRDLPYGWDSLLENLIDPAHVPFAHHGLQGSRKDAIPINMTVPVDYGVNGFSFYWEDRTMGKRRSGEGRFMAPFTISYNAEYETEGANPFKLTALCIPTKPGWSRAIIIGGSKPTEEAKKGKEKGKRTKKTSLIAKLFSVMPVWLFHQLSNRFLDSDLAFLHFQERQYRRDGASYYMPSQADRCIAAIRSWIPKYTDISSEPLPPEMSRSELFDRYTQHTSNCKHCLEGLEAIKKWKRNIYATLALSIFGFKFTIAKVSTLLCLGMLRLLHKLQESFRTGGFNHYENH